MNIVDIRATPRAPQ